MASKTTKRPSTAPRRPERKWGPFHGGVGVAVWLNEVEADEGKRYFRSNVAWLFMWRPLEAGLAVLKHDFPARNCSVPNGTPNHLQRENRVGR